MLTASGWEWVEFVAAAGAGKKRKPGFVASQKGSELRMDTRQAGSQRVSIGYLRTFSSTAVATVGCEPPCTCDSRTLHAHSSSRTSTTVFSPALDAESPHGANCTLRLRMLTDGQMFKLTALQVDSGAGGDDW